MTNPSELKSDVFLPFYDDFHFPRGFSRSGYFSKKQADILNIYGRRLCALWKEEEIPETQVERDFTEFCRGKREAGSDYDKAWRSYLEAIKHINSYIKTN